MDRPIQVATAVVISVSSVILIRLAGSWFRRAVLIPKLTVLDDLPYIGKTREGGRLQGQAVVCGGSIAGMLAAAVLSYHYEAVLIVEPEAWVTTEEGVNLSSKRETRLTEGGFQSVINKRSRIMQSTSFHAYLPVLTPVLRGLFSNYDQEIGELDLRRNTGNCDFRLHPYGFPPLPRPASQKHTMATYFSRQAFETFLRRCLSKSCKNVTWRVGNVTGVERSPSNHSLLQNVIIRTPEGSQIAENAALVVDATGPSQSGLKWLEKLGIALPPSMRLQYTANLRYSTMTFVIPPYLQERLPIPGGWSSQHFIYTLIADPDIETRAIALAINEGFQLTLACWGWDLENPPTNITELKELLASLKVDTPLPGYLFDICDTLQKHIDEIAPSAIVKKLPASVNNLYHELSKTAGFPANFVALGDAVMIVNPVFGQGCAKAGIGAATLDHVLRRTDPSGNKKFASLFFQKQYDRTESAWASNKDADYGYASTIPVEGENQSIGWFSRWFGRQLILMAQTDADLCWKIWDVRWFLLPPTDLMTPSILACAVWNWINWC